MKQNNTTPIDIKDLTTKRVDKTIQAMEKGMGFTEKEYASILKTIDKYAFAGFKCWVLDGTQPFNLNAYKRVLVTDGYNIGYIAGSDNSLIYWAEVTPDDIKEFSTKFDIKLSIPEQN